DRFLTLRRLTLQLNSTLFPYTTLFRSQHVVVLGDDDVGDGARVCHHARQDTGRKRSLKNGCYRLRCRGGVGLLSGERLRCTRFRDLYGGLDGLPLGESELEPHVAGGSESNP